MSGLWMGDHRHPVLDLIRFDFVAPTLLFINRVYPPVSGATGQLLAELAEALAQRGFQVTILTARYGTDPVVSKLQGVTIDRVKVLPYSRSSLLRRALSYLSVYPAFLWRALRIGRVDVIITMTDPPLHLLLSPLLKRKNQQLIHWAQDLYPEVAEVVGVIKKDGFKAKLLRTLSTWALKRQDRIVAVGHCMKSRIQARGVDPRLIRVIPNWALTDKKRADDGRFRMDHNLSGRFVVMYSGNIGLAHTFTEILEAAEILKESKPELRFVIIGEGAGFAKVHQSAGIKNLTNMLFLPPVKSEDLYQALRSADVHLATMKEEMLGLVIPSKVYGILASEKPCLFIGPEKCEAASLLLSTQTGLTIKNGDVPGLVAALIKLSENEEFLKTMQRNAARTAKNLSVTGAVESFHKLFQEKKDFQRA